MKKIDELLLKNLQEITKAVSEGQNSHLSSVVISELNAAAELLRTKVDDKEFMVEYTFPNGTSKSRVVPGAMLEQVVNQLKANKCTGIKYKEQ